MNAYETSATVEERGRVLVSGVPFAAGTEVEVTISPKRVSGDEFIAAWQRVCAKLRALPATQSISDDDIRAEVDRHRTGR